jgi:hypothetical protein
LTSSQFGETISTPKEKNPMKPDHSFRFALGVGGALFVLGVVAGTEISEELRHAARPQVMTTKASVLRPLPLYMPRGFLVDLQSGGVISGPVLGEKYEPEEDCQAPLAPPTSCSGTTRRTLVS